MLLYTKSGVFVVIYDRLYSLHIIGCMLCIMQFYVMILTIIYIYIYIYIYICIYIYIYMVAPPP